MDCAQAKPLEGGDASLANEDGTHIIKRSDQIGPLPFHPNISR
jgi:hypothetical protein